MGAIWDVVQHQQIRGANAASNSAMHAAEAARRGHVDIQSTVKALESRVEYLTIVSEALWELLAERGSLGEDDLAKKLIEVDSRDGKLDGRRTLPMVDCKCGAKVGSQSSKCAFCGQVREVANLFDRR